MSILSVKFFNVNNINNPILLAHAEDLSTMPLIARLTGSGSELLLFISRLFVERTEKGKIQGCNHDNYNGWVYHKINGIAGVIICSIDYDKRIALNFLQSFINIYEKRNANWDWKTYKIDNKIIDIELQDLMKKYQNPEDMDVITKINNDIEKTKITLHKSIDQMLSRGEKLDVMIDKSADLSMQSKKFYKKGKKLNNWCNSCIIS